MFRMIDLIVCFRLEKKEWRGEGKEMKGTRISFLPFWSPSRTFLWSLWSVCAWRFSTWVCFHLSLLFLGEYSWHSLKRRPLDGERTAKQYGGIRFGEHTVP